MKRDNTKADERVNNVELIGLINLMLSRIEDRSDDTGDIERIYEAVLRVYRGDREEDGNDEAQTSADDVERMIVGFSRWKNYNKTNWQRFGSVLGPFYNLDRAGQYIIFRTAMRLILGGMTPEEKALCDGIRGAEE